MWENCLFVCQENPDWFIQISDKINHVRRRFIMGGFNKLSLLKVFSVLSCTVLPRFWAWTEGHFCPRGLVWIIFTNLQPCDGSVQELWSVWQTPGTGERWEVRGESEVLPWWRGQDCPHDKLRAEEEAAALLESVVAETWPDRAVRTLWTLSPCQADTRMSAISCLSPLSTIVRSQQKCCKKNCEFR